MPEIFTDAFLHPKRVLDLSKEYVWAIEQLMFSKVLKIPNKIYLADVRMMAAAIQ